MEEEKPRRRSPPNCAPLVFEGSRKKFGGYGVVGVLKNGAGPDPAHPHRHGCASRKGGKPACPMPARCMSPTLSGRERAGDACVRPHDIHMTVFLSAAARMLAATRDQWAGTLVMIGPARRGARGSARGAMLTGGLYQKFPRPRLRARHA